MDKEIIQAASNLRDAFFKATYDTVYETADKNIAELSSVKEQVKNLAYYLASIGVKKGDSVAILSNTRAEWMIADLAIVSLGAISVSVYHSLVAEEVGFILYDSGAKVVFCENEEQINKLRFLSENEFLIPEVEDRSSKKVKLNFRKIISFESAPELEIVVELQTIFSDPQKPIEFPLVTRSDIAALVYTSGTTGPPKGVIQTHGNHLSNVVQAIDSGMFALDGSLFLFLPLAHSFAKLIGYIGFLTPAVLKFPSVISKTESKVDLVQVAKDMANSNAEVIPVVPRLFEKIKLKLEGIDSKLVRLTIMTALQVYEDKKQSKASTLVNSLLYHGTSPIRSKLKKKLFGGSFQHSISGGAKLPVAVNEFFDAIGIEIYEGYGLTETVVATNVNRKHNRKIGSVGPCLNGVEIKIADDGEILFRGPNISPGYYNRPVATKESFGEWFKTGDIGYLDQDGFLFITDRKKDLIVTAGGKKIPPQELENILKGSPPISQAVILGDGRPYIVALITVDPLAEGNILEQVRIVIEKLNQKRATYEQIKDFRIIKEDFTIENGFLTPTMKVKRKLVAEKFKELVEGMYL